MIILIFNNKFIENMKKIIGVIVVVVLIVLAILVFKNNQQKKEVQEFRNQIQETAQQSELTTLVDNSYQININESQLRWTGRTALKSHYGTIDIVDGTIDIKNEALQGIVTLNMNTITSEVGDGLDSHLKNEDFFDVINHPESVIAINRYENGILDIDLTIKQITNTIQIPALVSQEGEILTINGKAEIDRTLWGIEYSSGSIFDDLGDSAINDNFEIEFDLVANQI